MPDDEETIKALAVENRLLHWEVDLWRHEMSVQEAETLRR